MASFHPLERLLEELNYEVTPAIYELRSNTLRIILAQRGSDHRPTSFDGEKGSGEIVYILKRNRSVAQAATIITCVAILTAAGFMAFLHRRKKRTGALLAMSAIAPITPQIEKGRDQPTISPERESVHVSRP